MMRIVPCWCVALVSALCSIQSVIAEPVSDAEFTAWKWSFLKERQPLLKNGWQYLQVVHPGADVELYNTHMDKLDLSELKPSQWSWIAHYRMLDYSWKENGRDYSDLAIKAAEKRRHDPDGEGAAAAGLYAHIYVLKNNPRDRAEEFIRAALTHPGLPDMLREGLNPDFTTFMALHVAPLVLRQALADELFAYAAMLIDAAPSMLMDLEYLYERLEQLSKGRKEELERIRIGLIAALERAIESANTKNHPDTFANAEWFERAKKSLQAAPTVAGLEGRQAPELNFIWTNADAPLRSLADVRGKVIVLDFWATWCGPCVGAFPIVRALEERYAGLPVEIIGVTSLQGMTRFGGGLKNVVAETPEDEFDQMIEYIDVKEITWTIAFSEESVFNVDYGVQGIPHGVIIDPNGILRRSGRLLHQPYNDLTAQIDEILVEFELPTPGADE